MAWYAILIFVTQFTEYFKRTLLPGEPFSYLLMYIASGVCLSPSCYNLYSLRLETVFFFFNSSHLWALLNTMRYDEDIYFLLCSQLTDFNKTKLISINSRNFQGRFQISFHSPLLIGTGSARSHPEIENHPCHFKEEHWLHGCCNR